MTLVTPVLGVSARRQSIDVLNDSYIPSNTPPGSNTWPSANLAIYVPLRVVSRVVVKQLWLAATATGTGNADCGVYNSGGTRLVSAGSTARVAAVAEQVFDVTDTTIGPGLYYWALSCSNNTDQVKSLVPVAPLPAAWGVLSEALGSVTLPATATWVVDQTLALIPVGGILLETVTT